MKSYCSHHHHLLYILISLLCSNNTLILCISTNRKTYILISVRYVMVIKEVIAKLSYKMECKRSKRRIARENRDNHNAYTYTPSKRIVNVVLGVVCVAYGVWTIYLPSGSIWAIGLGLTLISCPLSIWSLIKGLWRDIKFYVGCRI